MCNETIEEQLRKLKEENLKLQDVANIAAFCSIDLTFNLAEAEKDWKSGKISKGAFNYVLIRHERLHIALYNAGYTEMDDVYDYPVKPKNER